jgi:hypothetical protein
MAKQSGQYPSTAARFNVCDRDVNGRPVAIPFTLGSPGTGRGHQWYVGGRPPSIIAELIPGDFYFFASFPFQADAAGAQKVCSVLVGDFDKRLEISGKWTASHLIQAIVHPASARVDTWPRPIELDGEADILLGAQKSDEVFNDAVGVETGLDGPKIGGSPFIISKPRLADEWRSLESTGFRQVLQVGWPALAAGFILSGTWPFGDGLFSLAAKENHDDIEWRWCWQLG